jgi:hypothetical protein
MVRARVTAAVMPRAPQRISVHGKAWFWLAAIIKGVMPDTWFLYGGAVQQVSCIVSEHLVGRHQGTIK